MATSVKTRPHPILVLPALALVVAVGGCVSVTDSSPSDNSLPTEVVAVDSSMPIEIQNSDTTIENSQNQSTGKNSAAGQDAIAPSTSSSSTIPSRGAAGVSPVGGGQVLALTLLLSITQANEQSNGYSRDLFRHWIDADGDRCNTREEVLIAESQSPAQVDPYGCKVLEGDWYSPFDNRLHTDPADLDIDHLVPLKEAWDSGAYSWTPSQREKFANDLSDGRSLIAVTSGVNRSKSDRDPSQWLPPHTKYVCTYISDWIAVKAAWSLTMDSSEWGRLKNLLNGDCVGTTTLPWTLSTSTPNGRDAAPSRPSTSITATTVAPSVVTTPSTSQSPAQDGSLDDLPTIKPGAFCTPQGALGIYTSIVYLCATTKTTGEPYSDGRARWRRQ